MLSDKHKQATVTGRAFSEPHPAAPVVGVRRTWLY
jgi:hypothetical protein